MTFMRSWKSLRLTSHTWLGLNPQIGDLSQGLSWFIGLFLVYFIFSVASNDDEILFTTKWTQFSCSDQKLYIFIKYISIKLAFQWRLAVTKKLLQQNEPSFVRAQTKNLTVQSNFQLILLCDESSRLQGDPAVNRPCNESTLRINDHAMNRPTMNRLTMN
jgi:hypothetical protein